MTIQIYVSADKTTFRGPFTHTPPLLAGETAVPITTAQYAALNAVRKANPGVTKFTWDGTTFTVAKIEQCRLAILALFNGLTEWEKELFKPQFQAVAARFAVGDVAGVQSIIANCGIGMPTALVTARDNMIAEIAALYGSNPPSAN